MNAIWLCFKSIEFARLFISVTSYFSFATGEGDYSERERTSLIETEKTRIIIWSNTSWKTVATQNWGYPKWIQQSTFHWICSNLYYNLKFLVYVIFSICLINTCWLNLFYNSVDLQTYNLSNFFELVHLHVSVKQFQVYNVSNLELVFMLQEKDVVALIFTAIM